MIHPLHPSAETCALRDAEELHPSFTDINAVPVIGFIIHLLAYIGYFDPGAKDDTAIRDAVVWDDVDQDVEGIRDNTTTDERIKHICTNLSQLLRGTV